MFKSKRDVDAHVAEIYRRIPSEAERNLKGYTVARLYYGIGEHNLALKYLDKFDQVRSNSAQSLKLRGQVFEALSAFDQDGGDQGPAGLEKHQEYKRLAVESYKRTLELDLSQKDLVLKICDLMLDIPVDDPEKTR